MIRLIEQNRGALDCLCVRHRVARLELFGSAAEGDFGKGQVEATDRQSDRPRV